MKHKHDVENYNGTKQQLAEEVGNLFYDSLAEFLKLLYEKIEKDSKADEARGRVKLAANLHECAIKLKGASGDISKAWKICEPYMHHK
jgi:hypothetical protein